MESITEIPTEQKVSELREFAVKYEAKRIQLAESKIKHRPRTSHWASGIPLCSRRGVYEWVEWSQKKLHDARLQLRFDEGSSQEDSVRQEFDAEAPALGFEVVERAVSLSPDMTSAHRIVGRLDFKLKSKATGKRYVAEVKSMSQWAFDKIEKLGNDPAIEHIKADSFLQGYYNQMQIYLSGDRFCEEGLFIFKCLDGRMRLIVVKLDLDRVQELIDRVDLMNRHIDGKTLPDRIPYDADTCGFCPFAHVCLPDVLNDAKLRIENNPKLEQMLKRRAELEPTAKEFKKIDEAVKDQVREVPMALVGDFVISGRWQERTSYDVPEDVKKQYQTKTKAWVTKIESPKPDHEEAK